ncbi:MAG: hypothetical protein ACRDHM_06995 [Actinomycetota bacterium]
MATKLKTFGSWLLWQLLTLAVAGVMAVVSAYVAYQGLMAAMRVVVGAP